MLTLDPNDALLTNRSTGLTAYVIQDDYPLPPEGDYVAQSELDAYHAGEVYGVVIADESGRIVDDCWGFYEWFSPNDPDSYIRQYADTELNYWAGEYARNGFWVTI